MEGDLPMDPAPRYQESPLPDGQSEPGSAGTVLRNLCGITSREAMDLAETEALWTVQQQLVGQIAPDHAFTAEDIRTIHRQWLGKIYSWAGQYRLVNIGKGGFSFATARAIPALMREFERSQLQRYTPPRSNSRDEVALGLAEVHVELMLIHPFREGNGRLGRLLAVLMALQAGLPPLDFDEWSGERREAYFAAVQMGMDRNYQPMTGLFRDVIERSLRLWRGH